MGILVFSSIQGNLKILVLTGSDSQFYGSYRYNSIGNSDSWFCLYTCASAHQNSYFSPVVSKNDSQLQDPRLNHFWFLFLAYIYLLLYMSAHYDIFQSPSGTWNGHVIFYWLESTLGKKKLSSREKLCICIWFSSFQCRAASKAEKSPKIS